MKLKSLTTLAGASLATLVLPAYALEFTGYFEPAPAAPPVAVARAAFSFPAHPRSTAWATSANSSPNFNWLKT